MNGKTYTDLTIEMIERAMEKVTFELGPPPYMKRVGPGLWEISSGGKTPTIMHTGDGGAEDFRKAMKKAAKEFTT